MNAGKAFTCIDVDFCFPFVNIVNTMLLKKKEKKKNQ